MFQKSFVFILPIFFLQGCSLFNSTPDCNNKQVKEMVKKLYASQVNPQPLSDLSRLQQMANPHLNQVNVQLQSTVGIELSDIKNLNPSNSEHPNNQQDDHEILDLSSMILDRFEGATYLCEGTIKEQVYGHKFEELKKQISEEGAEILQHNQMVIPVIYAVNYTEGSDEFEVQYSAKNPLLLMQAMYIKQAISDKHIDLNGDVDQQVETSQPK